ncbi:MAG: hypothetical protein F7C81_01745 [Desulfurococcales archaeon]|nr:hypothetical protein [Desulfurococcales archaeon]
MKRNNYMDAIDALKIASDITDHLFSSLTIDKVEGIDPKEVMVIVDNYYKNYSELLNIKNILINFRVIINNVVRKKGISSVEELHLLGQALRDVINEYINENMNFIESYCRNNLRNLNILIVPPGNLLNACVKRIKGRIYTIIPRLIGKNESSTNIYSKATLVPAAYIQGIIKDDVDSVVVQADSVFQQGLYSPPGSLAAVKVAREEGLRIIALSTGMVVRPTRISDLISGLKESIHFMMEWGEEISVYSNDAISMNDIDELILGFDGPVDLSSIKNISSRLLKTNSTHINYILKNLLEKMK